MPFWAMGARPAPLVPSAPSSTCTAITSRHVPSLRTPHLTSTATGMMLHRDASELKDPSAKLTIKVCLDTVPDTRAEGGERPWYDAVLPRGGDTHLLGSAEVPLANLASGAAAGVRHPLRGGQEGAWLGGCGLARPQGCRSSGWGCIRGRGVGCH